MCDLFYFDFYKITFYFQDCYQIAFRVLFTCKGVLICTFPSPAGLTSPKELTKARPVTQAHNTTQVRTPSRDVNPSHSYQYHVAIILL